MRRNIGSLNLYARVTSAVANQSRTGETGVFLSVDLAVNALSLNQLEKDIHDLKKVFLSRDGSVHPLYPTVQYYSFGETFPLWEETIPPMAEPNNVASFPPPQSCWVFFLNSMAADFFSVSQFEIWYVAVQQPVLLVPVVLCGFAASVLFWNVTIWGGLWCIAGTLWDLGGNCASYLSATTRPSYVWSLLLLVLFYSVAFVMISSGAMFFLSADC